MSLLAWWPNLRPVANGIVSFSSPPKLLQAEVVRSTVEEQREFSASQAQLIQQQIHRQSNVPQFHQQVVHHMSYWEASENACSSLLVLDRGKGVGAKSPVL